MGWMVSTTPRRFTPRKDTVPTIQEAGWAPGPVWTVAKNLVPTGLDPRTVQPGASRYTDWAIQALWNYIYIYVHIYLIFTSDLYIYICAVESGYNDNGLTDTSYITTEVTW